jgi:hypothetical protein
VRDADGGDVAFDLEPFVIGCVLDGHNVLLKTELIRGVELPELEPANPHCSGGMRSFRPGKPRISRGSNSWAQRAWR